MIDENKELRIKEFIDKWRSKIGQDHIEPTNVREIISQVIVNMPGSWNEDVEWGDIKRFALINDDLNALWFDEDYAKQSKWGGIIAPPLFIFNITLGLLWGMPISEENWEKEFYDQTLNGGCEIEFYEPIRPGDKIAYKDKLIDVFEKQGRRGKLLFVNEETTYTNQKGQVVAISRGSAILVRESKLSLKD